MVPRDPAIEQAVRQVGRELVAAVDEVAAEVARRVVAAMPELGAEHDSQVVAETLDSGVANVGAMAAMLAYGIPADALEPPHGAVEFARAMTRRGVELTAVLRAYRVGHAALADIWVAMAARELTDDRLLAGVLQRSLASMFDYIDCVCEALVEECRHEQQRWTRTAVAARAQVTRELLADAPGDADTAGRALGYDLRRHHVALIIWHVFSADDDAPGGDPLLLRAAAALAARCDVADPLVVPAGRGLIWAWLGSYPAFDPHHLRRALAEPLPDTVRVAAGQPGHGVDGFRTSHRQAERVMRVAPFTRAAQDQAVAYSDVALLSALCADSDEARAFATFELGGLLAADDASRQLRETLRVYLDTGCSHVRAARMLGVHEKTVTYRVRRAEAVLGHTVAERRTELAAALQLAGVLSPGVDPGPPALSPGAIAAADDRA
jgi:DNA-binding PucR family transcriptional regulator